MTSEERDEPEGEVARYVLGEMSLDEQLAFEVRMAADERLAGAVVAAMAIDEQLYRAAAREKEVARGVRRRPRGALRAVAVAASLLFALGVVALLWRGLPARSAATVAVMPTALRYEQMVSALGMTVAGAPLEAMRGTEAGLADGPARVDALLLAWQEQVQRAVAVPSTEVRCESFVVPVANERAVWVAVVGAFDDGRAQLYFPQSPEHDAAVAAGLLSPGTHVLPTPPATASTAQRERGVVAFAPGFVVPLGRTQVDVLVLSAPEPPSAEAWQRLRERVAMPGGDLAGDLATILPSASCRAFVVRAP